MGQAEGPEPQIGRGVGDAAQAVLDGVDGLVHHGVPEVELQREHRMRGAGSMARGSWAGTRAGELLLSPGTLCVTLHTDTVFSWFSTPASQMKTESCLDRFCRMTNAVM